MELKDIKIWGEKYLMPTYARYPVVLVKGEGVYVWDTQGRKYLDFVGGLAVNSLGHCHPAVTGAIGKQSNEIMHCSNLYWSIPQVELARLLVEQSSLDKVFFCNSGAEANEAAIKLVRRYAQRVLKEDRYKVITMKKSFHGRTIAAATATAQDKIHRGFDPLPGGFVYVQFNNIDALKEAIDEKTCAVILEPIQGEGGVNVADGSYLKEVEQLCAQRGALLVLDEVQCGMGRTGKMFAYQHYHIQPHVVTLAKALGGGIPIGAVLASEEVSVAFGPGSHGSTFGGNPMSCAAGIAVMEVLLEEGLIHNVAAVGKYLKEKLGELGSKYAFIKEVRGLGLMLGMELDIPGESIVDCCRERGLLINCTSGNVLRFLPPLTITEGHADLAVQILDEALELVSNTGEEV